MQFLLDRINYERTRIMPYGVAEFRLSRMRQLLARLGRPQRGLPIVHVAGTKGKGSTAAAIAAILSAAGYRTGLFTSPHLEHVEERIVIDGEPCRHEDLVQWIDQVRPVVEVMDHEAAARGGGEIGPTYFEILTAVALLCFARAKIDIAVLEVGLGGRLDATNVCRPLVSVITSISFDHTRQLGNTLAAIAGEKAGIVKRGVPVVSGVTADEPRQVVRQVCRRRGCRLIECGTHFDFAYRPPRHLEAAPAAGQMDFLVPPGDCPSFRGDCPSFRPTKTGLSPSPGPSPGATAGSSGRVPSEESFAMQNLSLALPGRHQAANTAVALAALAELRRSGWNMPEEAIRRGLAGLSWPARVEVAARRPVVVLDAAHNVASIEALLEVLRESFSVRRRLLIFAGTQEKDLAGMFAALLGQFDEVVLTQYLDNPRAVPAEELQALAQQLSGRRYAAYSQPADAWDAVRRLAAPEDLVCVTGSFFIAAEMRRQLAAQAPLSRKRERGRG